ncbi:LOB domain-containing protein 24-like [Salvia hispanica]|uniref:LOB domain-containing protein 24-like n=1 Tax=Salvia hispanica TaxID=49212 RepID=UPI0020093FA9|nr:LOB domain-containing protein 24-like [Salvia hispanica]
MNSSRCAACKHLRRRCPSDCIFAPYFPSNNPSRFAYVHKIYGASNVGKILQDLPVSCRGQAAETLYYEAYCRIKDPVYGCAGMVSVLHQQLNVAECQLATIKAEVAALQPAYLSDSSCFH